MKPEILVLCGPTCSGKSTFSKIHEEIYGHMTLSRDVFRENISKKYVYTKYNEDRVTATFNWWFNEFVKNGYSIILDNTHCSEKYLDAWIKLKPEGYNLRIFFFDVPTWKLHVRNIFRYLTTGKWIPLKVMSNMISNYNKINRKKYDLYL